MENYCKGCDIMLAVGKFANKTGKCPFCSKTLTNKNKLFGLLK